MGRILCELSLIGELDREFGFLEELEGSIDELLEDVMINSKSKVYKLKSQSVQNEFI